MTRILSLGQNNGLTIMILNLAPVRSYHLDTLSSLNFANRTKKIEVREIENEPVFKGCSRPVPGYMGPSIQRQPLRPLTSASHNSNVRLAVENAANEKSNKPAKAFSVYSDKSRPSTSAPKRSSPLKRTSDHLSSASSRPLKQARPAQPAMSKSAIEDMVEKKVAEILAARALEQPIAPAKDISEDVRKRLDYLEQKIEGQDDSRAEGLSFLLMAKQHQARGEDASALKMFELAQEHFPANTKLEAKIERLKQKIQEKKTPLEYESGRQQMQQVSTAPVHMSLSAASKAPKLLPSAAHEKSDEEEEAYRPSDASDGSDAEPPLRPTKNSKPRKPRSAKPPAPPATSQAILPSSPNLTLALTDPSSQTPRTKRLLHIINSRDVAHIRLLKGVGAKKAEAIIEALYAGDGDGDEEGGERKRGRAAMSSLDQLARLKGVGLGAKTVENMRLGLGRSVVLAEGDRFEF